MADADFWRLSRILRYGLPPMVDFLPETACRQISPGKNADLHPAPAVFTALPLGSFGFRLVVQAHPSRTASPTVRGPRAVDLPPASSPRPLTGGAVAFG